MWHHLYSTVSSRDIGTMFAARNITNSRNVSADPSANYYAAETMADKFTDAYIVAGALDHFEMDSVMSEPEKNEFCGSIGNSEEMKDYIISQAKKFVKKNVYMEVSPLPEYGPQSNTFKCRNCDKSYKQSKALRKHEHTCHGQFDPLYSKIQNENLSLVSESSENQDMILNYTKLTLGLSLLRLNHNDAISLSDGDRIMLVNQYLCLLYKRSNCPKYAYGLLETICQSKILLTARLAHRLKWNRTVNHRGKIDSNHPNDLDIEHCNKMFKDDAHSFRGIFTEKTISRVSRSTLYTNQITKNYDAQTNTRTASGTHEDADLSQDVNTIVAQLVQNKVFKSIPGRKHAAFPVIEANPFSIIDMEDIQGWISKSLSKFSAKHYY